MSGICFYVIDFVMIYIIWITELSGTAEREGEQLQCSSEGVAGTGHKDEQASGTEGQCFWIRTEDPCLFFS